MKHTFKNSSESDEQQMAVRGPAHSHTDRSYEVFGAHCMISRRTKRAQLTLRRLDITQLLSMNQPSWVVGGFWFCGCNYAEKLTFAMFTFSFFQLKRFNSDLQYLTSLDGWFCWCCWWFWFSGWLSALKDGGWEFWGFTFLLYKSKT